MCDISSQIEYSIAYIFIIADFCGKWNTFFEKNAETRRKLSETALQQDAGAADCAQRVNFCKALDFFVGIQYNRYSIRG